MSLILSVTYGSESGRVDKEGSYRDNAPKLKELINYSEKKVPSALVSREYKIRMPAVDFFGNKLPCSNIIKSEPDLDAGIAHHSDHGVDACERAEDE